MKRLALALGVAMFFLTASSLSADMANGGTKNPIVIPKVETIHGTLNIVGEEHKLIFLRTTEGVIYDFRITPETKLAQAGRPISFHDVSNLVGKELDVTFRATKTGNTALKVEFQ